MSAVSTPEVSTSSSTYTVTKPTVLDVPVSNHGARVRYILYKKKLEDVVDVASPAAVGGLGSDLYATLNPQRKMPLLVLPDGLPLPESEVIAQYILDAYRTTGPALTASTPEGRAVAALVSRLHDQYVTPIQACLYRAMSGEEREEKLKQLVYQLDVVEATCKGPHMAGLEVTGADATWLGTMVFLTEILPRVFHWGSVFQGRPKLAAWWALMQQDPAAAKVIDEVRGGLEGWFAKGRWGELGISEQVDSGKYKLTY